MPMVRHVLLLVLSASLSSVSMCESQEKRDSDVAWRRTRSFLAGLSSGMALVIAGHPFDTIKGVTPPLATVGITQSILFGLQSMAVDAVKGKAGANRPPTVVETMKAAVLSGFAISVLVQPIDGVKARLQVQYDGASKVYAGPLDCARKVVSKLGIWRGLYRGWTATALCRSCMFAYFGTYELLRKQFGMTAGSSGGRSVAHSLGVSVLCGSLTGVSYWSCCYPFDVVRSRLLVAPDTHPPLYRNGLHCAQEIYRAQGWRGFVAGFSPCILRSVPANAAAFLAYELSMHLLPLRLAPAQR